MERLWLYRKERMKGLVQVNYIYIFSGIVCALSKATIRPFKTFHCKRLASRPLADGKEEDLPPSAPIPLEEMVLPSATDQKTKGKNLTESLLAATHLCS